MSGHHVAAAFGLLILLGTQGSAALRRDDDDDKPQRGPQLAAGKELGLALTLSRGELSDTRAARLVALEVPDGSPVSPFLSAGPFRAVWAGDLAVPFRSDFTFSAAGRGTIKVEVNGKLALEGSGDDLSLAPGQPIKLRKGANKLVVTYESPATGDAIVRLAWSSEDFAREPIPPIALARDLKIDALSQGTRLREGRALLADLRCLKCHAPASSIGGPGSMPELATDAPNLSDAGARLRLDWMARWIEDPKSLRPTSTMPKVLHGSAAGPARDIAAYLATLGSEAEALPTGSAETGGRLFANLGCVGCHTLPDFEGPPDARRLSLRTVGAKWKPQALVRFLQQPDRHYAWIKMPNFHLSSEEAEALAAYVTSSPVRDLANPGQPAADATRGKALFGSEGCSSCHALPGIEAIKATPFATLQARASAAGCLAPSGSEGRKAPDYGLSAGSLEALRSFVGIGLESLGRECAPEFAERQVKALNCAACHKRDGWDDAWTDLKVETDRLLAGVPLDEKDPDGLPYPADQVRPSLTWIGEKLKPEWAASFIAGQVSYKPRPYLRARMPAFATRAEGLAVGLALEHGFPSRSPAEPAPDPDQVVVAKQLVKNTGLNCVSCHNIGMVPAVGVFEAPGINFMRTSQRIRHDYFERWLRSPIRVEPETKMPTYFTGENSVLPTILDRKADRQIKALWNYLLQGPEIEPPGN